MSQTLSKQQSRLLAELDRWMREEVSSEQLASNLGVGLSWVDEFQAVVDQFHEALSSNRITLSPTSTTGDVQADEKIVVILHSMKINRLFTDYEKLEREDQEGTVVLNFNGQTTTIAWKRLLIRRGRPKKWGPYKDEQKRVLFVGDPQGLVDIDAVLIESDEPERAFFEKIARLLESAATFAGFAPGLGSTVSTGLKLGAAVAELIKAKIDDDAEFRYLGSIGGQSIPLRYGEYLLKRHTQSGSSAEIEAVFEIAKFETSSVPKHATILLDDIEYQSVGKRKIGNLREEDRVLADVTVTRTPADSTADDEDSRVASLKIDRPYFAENGANWQKTLGIAEKLLYDGPWGINIAFSVNMSGVPRDINAEQWMEIIQKTGGLVSSLVPTDQQASVRRGFEIAEAARSTIVKFLPATRFAASLSSLLFVGNHDINGLYKLADNENWQDVSIPLDIGNYGRVIFRLKIRLKL